MDHQHRPRTGVALVDQVEALAGLERVHPPPERELPFEELRFRHTMFVEGVYELPVTW